MPTMVLSRDASLHIGMWSTVFKANVPQEIPDVFVQDALKIGAKATDDKQDKLVQEAIKPKPQKKEPEGDNRYKQVVAHMRELKAENDPENFSAGGIPLQAVVEKRCGFRITAQERKDAWMFVANEG